MKLNSKIAKNELDNILNVLIPKYRNWTTRWRLPQVVDKNQDKWCLVKKATLLYVQYYTVPCGLSSLSKEMQTSESPEHIFTIMLRSCHLPEAISSIIAEVEKLQNLQMPIWYVYLTYCQTLPEDIENGKTVVHL